MCPSPECPGRDQAVEAVLADEIADLREVVAVADQVVRAEAGPVAQRRVARGGDVVRTDERPDAAGAKLLADDAVAGGTTMATRGSLSGTPNRSAPGVDRCRRAARLPND